MAIWKSPLVAGEIIPTAPVLALMMEVLAVLRGEYRRARQAVVGGSNIALQVDVTTFDRHAQQDRLDGNLVASGTVSGPEKDQRGACTELTRGGRAPVTVRGKERTLLLAEVYVRFVDG